MSVKKEIIVIKCGGSLLKDKQKQASFFKEVLSLQKKHSVILVHGGGADITATLDKLGIKTRFVNGLRYTDKPTMEVVEMVLSGKMNKYLVEVINILGGKAIGISGKDGKTVIAKRIKSLGLVGTPVKVNTQLLKVLIENGFLPVISPIGIDTGNNTVNINADDVAGAIATALKVKKLIYLTDVSGVLDQAGKTISRIRIKEVEGLIKNQIVTGGMIPKLRSAVFTLKKGVGEVDIINGNKGLLKSVGTQISAD